MDDVKYIVVDYKGMEIPIFFGFLAEHSQIANRFGIDKVISAGFVRFTQGDGIVDLYVYGKSISIKKESRMEIDVELFKKMLENFEFKYILIDNAGYFRDNECVICFPNCIEHDDIISLFNKVVSSGYISLGIQDGEVHCNVHGGALNKPYGDMDEYWANKCITPSMY